MCQWWKITITFPTRIYESKLPHSGQMYRPTGKTRWGGLGRAVWDTRNLALSAWLAIGSNFSPWFGNKTLLLATMCPVRRGIAHTQASSQTLWWQPHQQNRVAVCYYLALPKISNHYWNLNKGDKEGLEWNLQGKGREKDLVISDEEPLNKKLVRKVNFGEKSSQWHWIEFVGEHLLDITSPSGS